MNSKFKIGLQFFASEMSGAAAGVTAAAAGVAQPAEGVAAQTGEQAKNGVATVSEGEALENEGDEIEATADPDAEFESLIGKSGKYNKQFTARVDEILKKRHGQSEGMKAEISSLSGKVAEFERGLAPLYQLYGVQTVSELYDKISSNSSFWEEEAERRGVTAHELQSTLKRDMELTDLKRENEKLKAAEQKRANDAKQRAQYEQWDAQINELKKSVPDFDMRSEMENNHDFAKLIRAGIGIDMAYSMTHIEDQISKAREDGKKEAADAIAARKARPRENASSYSGGATISSGVPKTAVERAAVAKRVKGGETGVDFIKKF